MVSKAVTLTAGVSTVSALERPLWHFNDPGLLNVPSLNPAGKSACFVHFLCIVGVLNVLSFRLRSCGPNLIIYTFNCCTVSFSCSFNFQYLLVQTSTYTHTPSVGPSRGLPRTPSLRVNFSCLCHHRRVVVDRG